MSETMFDTQSFGGFEGVTSLADPVIFETGGDLDTSGQDDSDERIDGEDEEEDLWVGTLDHESDEAAIRASLPPEGWYEGQGLTSTRVLKGADGGLRRVYRYYGKGYRDDQQAKVRFSISRDISYKEDAGGSKKLAWDYQFYNKAKKAYTFVHGQKPKTMGQLDDFLCNAILRFRVVHTEDDILVVDIGGVKV